MAPHFVRRKSSSETPLIMHCSFPHQRLEEEGTKRNQLWVSDNGLKNYFCKSASLLVFKMVVQIQCPNVQKIAILF